MFLFFNFTRTTLFSSIFFCWSSSLQYITIDFDFVQIDKVKALPWYALPNCEFSLIHSHSLLHPSYVGSHILCTQHHLNFEKNKNDFGAHQMYGVYSILTQGAQVKHFQYASRRSNKPLRMRTNHGIFASISITHTILHIRQINGYKFGHLQRLTHLTQSSISLFRVQRIKCGTNLVHFAKYCISASTLASFDLDK